MRTRAAGTYQRRNAPLRVMARLAVPGIKRELKAALIHLGTSLDGDKAVALIRNGLPMSVKREAVQWGHFREVLKAPFARLGELHAEAGKHGARKINGVFAQRRRPVVYKASAIARQFAFDRFSPATQNSIRLYQDRFIAQLAQDARDTIDAVILAGQRAGLDAGEIVANVRDVIGLTDRQALAVQNYRAMLYASDPLALTRQLSEYADDAALQSAINAGVSMSDVAIENAVANYENNYLDYRALTIAQTESIRAANVGLHDSYTQMVERGVLTSESVTRQWRVALDERTCPVCLSIPDLNPDGVGLNDDFDSEDGAVTDPPVHPSCRCSVDFITNLDMLPAQEEEVAA